MSTIKHFCLIYFLFILMMSGCKKKEDNPLERLNSDLTSGTWKITQLLSGDINQTPEFEHYRLTFSKDKAPESPQEIFNRLISADRNQQYHGTWIFMHGNHDEPYTYFLSVAFINDTIFQPISTRWGIDTHTTGNLQLHKQAEEYSTDSRIMVLKKE